MTLLSLTVLSLVCAFVFAAEEVDSASGWTDELCDVCTSVSGSQQAMCLTYCQSELSLSGRRDIAPIRTAALGNSDVKCLREECLRYDPDDDDDNDEEDREECLRNNKCRLDDDVLKALKKLDDETQLYEDLPLNLKNKVTDTLRAAAARCCAVVELSRLRALARRTHNFELEAPRVPFSSVANCLIGCRNTLEATRPNCVNECLKNIQVSDKLVPVRACNNNCTSISAGNSNQNSTTSTNPKIECAKSCSQLQPPEPVTTVEECIETEKCLQLESPADRHTCSLNCAIHLNGADVLDERVACVNSCLELPDRWQQCSLECPVDLIAQCKKDCPSNQPNCRENCDRGANGLFLECTQRCNDRTPESEIQPCFIACADGTGGDGREIVIQPVDDALVVKEDCPVCVALTHIVFVVKVKCEKATRLRARLALLSQTQPIEFQLATECEDDEETVDAVVAARLYGSKTASDMQLIMARLEDVEEVSYIERAPIGDSIFARATEDESAAVAHSFVSLCVVAIVSQIGRAHV